MNNSLPELTPEQLRQLNAISGLQKTRRRGADASVPSALTAESESGEAPDISASYALPKPAPNMSEEDYERQIKEGLTEHIEAIYDRAGSLLRGRLTIGVIAACKSCSTSRCCTGCSC